MKGKMLRGFLELSGGVLLTIAWIVTCTLRVNASSVPGLLIERAVPLLPPSVAIDIDSWVIYLFAGLLVVALVIAVIVLLLKRKKTSARKKPAQMGMPPIAPPPIQAAITTPTAATPQPLQPITAAPRARLLMPDSTEVPLSEGLRFIGRSDFERMVPPDRADFISRQHLAVGFARGNYYVLSISEMGHFLNRTLLHNQAALTSSVRA